ncbi:hypothetical protein FSPOR_6257 [Fusarium sporotrichioides]|uniref:Glycine-rich cell wall structural 1 n=1 Tax=Fusarium sporotrichioides TaxID=5514 RepID=A0A395S3R3_FUSSP|nr:hypothetical protein FSPOR_6257 [Fusarium sporotrichioides]
METINNLTATASKAIWGENETSNKEPVSGVKGDTARGEPYDAGNLETPQQEKVAKNFNYGQHGEEQTSGLGREAHVSSSSTTTAASSAIPAPAAAPNHSKDTTAEQNDTRTPEQAEKGKKDLHDVDDTSEGTDAKIGEGPGPRPIEKLAKEFGGDAGNAPVEGASSKHTEVGSGAGESSNKENQPHDPKEDEYITASGFAADGGDFDATNPGAGREADRLMEQKGIHLGESGSSDPTSHTESHSSSKHHGSSHEDKKDKPSLGERIKAKLHKH